VIRAERAAAVIANVAAIRAAADQIDAHLAAVGALQRHIDELTDENTRLLEGS